jgi:TATA-box binding protein (TBP) (component of TFIID and TFIIIB)
METLTYDINAEWENYNTNNYDENECSTEDEITYNNDIISANLNFEFNSNTPVCSDIYISTKTKIAYLNKSIDLQCIFWKVPVMLYGTPSEGVIKKQIKFNSTTQEELDYIKEKLKDELFVEEYVLTSINNPDGRIKFKDIRKISIGVCQKDIMRCRNKQKSAFYNCFVLIIRLQVGDLFKEFHVKIFNTGKIEIPGIQNEEIFQKLLLYIIEILQPYFEETIDYNPDSEENVLINSNFNCGYFINREVLHDILKYKYKIHTIYDPCSYPGIQCKFYYNHDVLIQTGSQILEVDKSRYNNIKDVSFMIFRTGSVLIVGKCNEVMLMEIYNYLKNILNNEYHNIVQKNNIAVNKPIGSEKKKKLRKKTISVNIV